MRLGRWRKSEVREYVEAILMAVAVALRAARVRHRGLQDPERLDDPDAHGGRPHLRQQVQLRPGDSVHAARASGRTCRPKRGRRDGLRVPRAPRAGLHQARHRAPGRQARGDERPPDHQRVGGAELPRRRVDVQRLRLAHQRATRATSTSSTSATSRTSRSTTTPRAASPSTRARSSRSPARSG